MKKISQALLGFLGISVIGLGGVLSNDNARNSVTAKLQTGIESMLPHNTPKDVTARLKKLNIIRKTELEIAEDRYKAEKAERTKIVYAPLTAAEYSTDLFQTYTHPVEIATRMAEFDAILHQLPNEEAKMRAGAVSAGNAILNSLITAGTVDEQPMIEQYKTTIALNLGLNPDATTQTEKQKYYIAKEAKLRTAKKLVERNADRVMGYLMLAKRYNLPDSQVKEFLKQTPDKSRPLADSLKGIVVSLMKNVDAKGNDPTGLYTRATDLNAMVYNFQARRPAPVQAAPVGNQAFPRKLTRS
jgi:hypothetical protein